MTLYGSYIGGDSGSARSLDQWAGEPFDAFLAYTEGWDSNNWNGLRPTVVTERAGALGDTKRRLLWSIMMMVDDAGVNGYRSIARGERRALHEQIGRDLIAYHDSIGDTGPIYVRSTWEVPGEWFGWNVAATEDPGAFKAAWQQFADALRGGGRSRIKTVWDFNSDRGKVEHLYPGNDAIDVISQDIYWIHDLQGRDPVAAFHRSRHGYSRGLQWHLEWCRELKRPMAIAEFGVKLNEGGDGLDCTTWFREFFKFVDECNAPGNPGMAFVTWWNKDDANVGEFTRRVGEPHQSAVKEMFRQRLPGSIWGGGGGTLPPVNPPTPPAPTVPVNLTHGSGADALILKISQQPYDGPAQYRVLIDGQQVGATFTASALRSAEQSDTLTLKSDLAAGSHQARVELVNDAYGGSSDKDRNLYLDAASINGEAIAGVRKDIKGPNEAAVFSFTKRGTGPQPPDPAAPPAGGVLEELQAVRADIKALTNDLAEHRAGVQGVFDKLHEMTKPKTE